MRLIRLLGGAGVLLCSAWVVATADSPPAPALPKDFRLPADVDVVLYLPPSRRKTHFYSPVMGATESSEALGESLLTQSRTFFRSSQLAEPFMELPYGLLVALHPDVRVENNVLYFTMEFAVYGPDQHEVLKGQRTTSTGLNLGFGGNVLGRLAQQASEQVMTEVITTLRPERTKYPSSGNLKSQSLDFAVDRDQPWSTGTGFYINGAGQILTAAHVIHDCTVIEVHQDKKIYVGKALASSSLLDLAVLVSEYESYFGDAQ